jgi:hypothetical protein
MPDPAWYKHTQDAADRIESTLSDDGDLSSFNALAKSSKQVDRATDGRRGQARGGAHREAAFQSSRAQQHLEAATRQRDPYTAIIVCIRGGREKPLPFQPLDKRRCRGPRHPERGGHILGTRPAAPRLVHRAEDRVRAARQPVRAERAIPGTLQRPVGLSHRVSELEREFGSSGHDGGESRTGQ